MQVLQKLSILFYLRKTRKSETGLVPIYVRISIDGRRDTIATGISVPEDAWDAVHKQVLTFMQIIKKLMNLTLLQVKEWKTNCTIEKVR